MNQRLITKVFVAASYAVLCIAKAGAADYAAGLAINTEASHNDNIQFLKKDKTSVNKYDLSPTLTFGINTETTQVELDSTLNFNRYDKSEFNSSDQNIALALSRQFESSSVGLNAGYIHNSTITSEQLTSGRIGNKADRSEQYTLSPNWTYTVTETNLIKLTGTYTNQNYGNAAYIGYKNTGAELDWIHIINDRVKLTAAATYSKYKSDDVTLEVPATVLMVPGTLFGQPISFPLPAGFIGEQSYASQTKSKGIQVGVEYQLSEQSLIKARIGDAQNRNSYTVKDSSNVCTNPDYLTLVAYFGPIGGGCDLQNTTGAQSTSELDWTWSNEKQQLNLNASKATQPTSNGYTVDATQVGASWSYQLAELDKISTSISLVRNRAMDNKNPLQNASIADRNYGSATLQYQRQLNEYWFLSTSFQFSEQKYTQVDYQASSRVYSLGLSYKPQQWHWAR